MRGILIAVLALPLPLALACATQPTEAPNDAGESYPSLGSDARGAVDPLASDAPLGVRARQVFGGCQGGPSPRVTARARREPICGSEPGATSSMCLRPSVRRSIASRPARS